MAQVDHNRNIKDSIHKLSKKADNVEKIHQESTFPSSPEEAWQYLTAGNARYVKGDVSAFLSHISKEVSHSVREELTKGQKPYVTIVSCSDSRVPPELIFDEGLGRLFVIRVAGNIVDNFALGTVEYGVHHLHTPLLLVMGHQFCGAVKATKDCQGKIPEQGDVPHLIREITPCCAQQLDQDPGLDLDATIQKNVRHTKQKLLKNEAVKKLVEEKKLKIVMAEYYLDTGKVCEISDEETDQKKVFFGDAVSIKNAKTGEYLTGEAGKLSTSATDNSRWVIKAPHGGKHFKKGNPIGEGDRFRLELQGSQGKHLHADKEGKATAVADEEELDNLHLHLSVQGNYPELTLREGASFSIHHAASNKFFSSNSSHEVSLSEHQDVFVIEKIVDKHKN